jgi:hypothetical protein
MEIWASLTRWSSLLPCESPDGLLTRNGDGSAVDHEYIVFIMVLHGVGITEHNRGPFGEDKVHLVVDDGGRHGVCRVFEVEAESWKERGIRERERERERIGQTMTGNKEHAN